MRTLTVLAVSQSRPHAHRDDELDAATPAGQLHRARARRRDRLPLVPLQRLPISSGNDFQGAMRDAIRQQARDALIQATAATSYQNFLIVSRY